VNTIGWLCQENFIWHHFGVSEARSRKKPHWEASEKTLFSIKKKAAKLRLCRALDREMG
jgi:hypothetical protein